MTTYVDLRFTDATGRRRVVYAAMTDSGAWDVRGIVGGQPYSKQCDSWQAVERAVVWLRRHAHEPAPLTTGRITSGIAAAIAVIVLLGGTGVAFAQDERAQSPAIQAFVAATRDYAAMHRRLEATLPRLDVTSNPGTIYRLVQDMAAVVRQARPAARAGDVFAESVAVEFRARIADALAASGFTAEDVLIAEAAEGVNTAMASLEVNGPFPWIYATAMFPCVLAALPPLPPELQYRLVGSTLVLIDVHANLIVDVLPYALAATER